MIRLFPVVEFYITNVCNLTCRGCNRFNNYNFKGHQLWADHANAYEAWAKRLDLPRIVIIGGEPTLNPDLELWASNLRRLWPDSVIMIQTTCSPTLSHWGSALILDGGFDEERGYLFNYQRINMPVTSTAQTAFVIRLAPSVENSQIGALGAKALLNRSQLLLEEVGVAISAGSISPGVGNIIIEGVLNPKNFTTATWSPLNTEQVGGQPSFAQVAQGSAITWQAGTTQFAIPGEQVFAFAGQATTSGAVNDRLNISQLKELTGAPLGGDFKYPDGPDVLAINIRTTQGTANAAVLLRWSEAQA